MPNTCQKVNLNFIVLNNALIRNFICVFGKKRYFATYRQCPSNGVSDDLFHNFYDSFKTK